MTPTGAPSEPAPPEVYAELSAWAADDHVFEPSLVTARLGVEPTRAYKAGDALPWGGVRAHGSWCWTVFPNQVAHYADDVVNVASSALVGREDAMAGLREEHKVEFQLGLVVEMHVARDEDGEPIARTPTLGLSKDNVERLASLSLAYDIDLCVLS